MNPKNPEESAAPNEQEISTSGEGASESEKKIAEYREQMLRLKADFDNTKKRLERDRLDSVRFANERLLAEIVGILDGFDLALRSLEEGHDAAKVKQGLKLVQTELHKVLDKNGVQAVKSVGEAFDPQLHEAVATVDSADAQDGTVVDEVQKGYTLNGRLLRPSRVRIARNHSE
jgi:molecular chaperone GrpE